MNDDTRTPGHDRIARKLGAVDPDDLTRTYRRAFEAVTDPHQLTLFQCLPASPGEV